MQSIQECRTRRSVAHHVHQLINKVPKCVKIECMINNLWFCRRSYATTLTVHVRFEYDDEDLATLSDILSASQSCCPLYLSVSSIQALYHSKFSNSTLYSSIKCCELISTFRHAGPLPDASGKRDKETVALLLRAALAGGLSSGCSTLLMHPLDTLKTRVQSIPGASIQSVVKSVPELGARAMYRGIIPAVSGSFSSHGIRTCGYEACMIALGACGVPYMQAQPVASFVGTFVGTLVRIPCEVLKQQLQAGRHENVKVRISDTI